MNRVAATLFAASLLFSLMSLAQLGDRDEDGVWRWLFLFLAAGAAGFLYVGLVNL